MEENLEVYYHYHTSAIDTKAVSITRLTQEVNEAIRNALTALEEFQPVTGDPRIIMCGVGKILIIQVGVTSRKWQNQK